MVANYYGRKETPDSINTHLKQLANGFAAGSGWYYWGALPRLFSDISEKITWTSNLVTDDQMAEIKTALDTGYPVMLQIDFNQATPAPEMHFVLAVGYNPTDENDITIADPWTGTQRSLKDYLGGYDPSARVTIQSYEIYPGPVPTTATALSSTVIDWPDAETNHQTVGWYVREWNVEKVQRQVLQGQVSSLTAKNGDLQGKADAANKALAIAADNIVELTGKLTKGKASVDKVIGELMTVSTSLK